MEQWVPYNLSFGYLNVTKASSQVQLNYSRKEQVQANAWMLGLEQDQCPGHHLRSTMEAALVRTNAFKSHLSVFVSLSIFHMVCWHFDGFKSNTKK